MNIKKTIYLALGCIGVGLGALGAVGQLRPPAWPRSTVPMSLPDCMTWETGRWQ